VGSRTARGQTSTRDNRAHYQTHIAPAIGGNHVRDWTVDDMRMLSRYLDGQIQTAAIAWKTARNVWASLSGPRPRTTASRSGGGTDWH
jgi:hypothetical protein